MISLIVQQSSNINGYVLDCFSGSGTTLLAAIQMVENLSELINRKYHLMLSNKNYQNTILKL